MKMPHIRSTLAAMVAAAVATSATLPAHASMRSTAPMPWGLLQAQLDAGGVVTLTGDVTAIDGDTTLTVTNAVTLDLNGHTIAFNGSKEVFHVGSGGDLTLTNSLAAGAVTGGGDHGVYMSDGTFTVSGSPVVSDNTNSVGAAKNVYLEDGCAITVSNLTAGAHIGVKSETAPTLSNPVTFATDASEGDAAYFFSDVFGYEVKLGGSDLQLVGELPQGFKDPEGREIEDYGVVEWLSNNGFTQAAIEVDVHYEPEETWDESEPEE